MYLVGEVASPSLFSLLYNLVSARNVNHRWTLFLSISKSSMEIRHINKIIIVLYKCSQTVHKRSSRNLVEGQVPNLRAGGEGGDQEMLFKKNREENI